MSNFSLLRKLFGVFLSCLLAGVQSCAPVFDSWSVLNEQCEASFPEDSEETEADAAVTVSEMICGRRVVRRRIAESIFQKQAATIAAHGATARWHSRLPLDRKAVAERVRPLLC